MAEILYRMYDLNPKNPTTITDGISIACSDVNAVYPIGSAYTRHAFIVIQDADIIVKNAAGNTLQRGADYFISASAADQRYSKDYNTSIYSGIKFKATGTYTVTSFISCGTYPRATWFNYLWDQLVSIRDTTVANLSATVSSLSTSVSNMAATVYSTAASLSDLSSLFDTHVADTTFHITSAERAAWNNKTNTYFVANITERNALAGLKSGDRVVVWDDGDGKRAVYFYSGSTWLKDDDPDWENVNVAWSALLNIPANVAAVVNSTGVTATATAGAVAMWNASGKLLSTTPTDADANQTVATVEYVKSKVSLSGGGNLSTSDAVSVDGEVVVTDGTTGKLHKKSGVLFSTITTAISTLQGYFTGGVANKSSNVMSGVLSGTGESILTYFQNKDLAIGFHQFNLIGSEWTVMPPDYSGNMWVFIDVVVKTENYKKLRVHSIDSLAVYERCLIWGTWQTAWNKITDVNGNAVNANSLGGVAAASYALKTDTSPDSSKLGGTAAAYFFKVPALIEPQESKVFNTTYTAGSTPIFVTVSYCNAMSGSYVYVAIGGSTVMKVTPNMGSSVWNTIQFFVPAGKTYLVGASTGTPTVTYWAENK